MKEIKIINPHNENEILIASKEAVELMREEYLAVNAAAIKSDSDSDSDSQIFELSKEHHSVSDYLNQNNVELSSFEEAIPNYALKTDLVDDVSVFEVVKQVQKILDDCVASGYNKDCFKQIKLSGIVEKVLSNGSSDTLKKKVGDVILAEYDKIIEKIGQTTLLEVYNKFKDINEKLVTTINPNYKEIGYSLIGYGILIRTFNKIVLDRPIPKSVIGEELKIIQSTRTFSKFLFAGLIAPLMLFSFHHIREKNSLFNINVNVNLPNVNIENDNNSTKESNLGLFFLLKQLKTKVNSRVLIITMLIFILMF